MKILLCRVSLVLIPLFPLVLCAADKRITQEIPVEYFDRITVSDATRLTIVQAQTPSLKVTASAELMERIEAKQSGTSLYLGLKSTKWGWFDWKRHRNEEVLFEVRMPVLKELNISGASKTRLNDMQSGNLRLKISGASHLTASKINFADLRADISGASHTEIAALTAQTIQMDLSGASNVKIAVLQANTLDVDLSGASNCEISDNGKAEYVMVHASGASGYHGKKLLSEHAKVKTSGASHAYVNAREAR